MTDAKGPVLVATALDEGSDDALRQGVEIARARGVACTACHVLPEILGIRPLLPHLQEIDRDTAAAVRDSAAAMFDLQVSGHFPRRRPRHRCASRWARPRSESFARRRRPERTSSSSGRPRAPMPSRSAAWRSASCVTPAARC